MTRFSLWVAIGMAAYAPLSSSAADMLFVEAGQPVDVSVLGPAWETRDGALTCKGQNSIAHRLLAGKGLGAGNFVVEARLSLDGLARSAAAFVLGEKTFFGFAGGHGKVFITGPWFDNARGTPIGNPGDFMTDGHPFDFVVERKDDLLTIAIDGKELYRQKGFRTGAIHCFGFTPVRATMRIESFRARGTPAEFKKPYVFVKRPPVLHGDATALPQLPQGPFVRLGDDRIMTVDATHVLTSADQGKTWQQGSSLFEDPDAYRVRPERALLRSREGVVLLFFLNEAEKHYAWDRKTNTPLPGMTLPTYCLRSEDDGKTWSAPILLYDGWCGALRDAIQTQAGTIVVPGQELLMKEGRHCTRPYYSLDLGRTWHTCEVLDIGGRGDHAGAIEPTLIQLRNGHIRMLIRSYHGHFYESWSTDDGRTWSDPEPSSIQASGAPGILTRLQDGDLVLIWNRLYLSGTTTKQHRTELSIAFSADDGVTWSDPVVLATNADGTRNNANRVAYPYVFEVRPGYLWVTSMQGELRCGVAVQDLWKAVP